jgi:hypothetical protein
LAAMKARVPETPAPAVIAVAMHCMHMGGSVARVPLSRRERVVVSRSWSGGGPGACRRLTRSGRRRRRVPPAGPRSTPSVVQRLDRMAHGLGVEEVHEQPLSRHGRHPCTRTRVSGGARRRRRRGRPVGRARPARRPAPS